jgi:hypothetical protein
LPHHLDVFNHVNHDQLNPHLLSHNPMPFTIQSPPHVVTSDVIAKNLNKNVFFILCIITLICDNLNS